MASTQSISAQLNKISEAERSDGKGYVIRLQLTQIPDSFRLFQSAPGLVQIAIYGDFDGKKVDWQKGEALENMQFSDFPYGLGIDMELAESISVAASIYPDKNGSDLLVALTNTSSDEIEILTNDLFPIEWPEPISQNEASSELPDSLLASDESELSESEIPLFDASYEEQKNKLKFDVVVIDPGHGGKDPGSLGRKHREKDIALSIAKKLGAYIKQYLPGVNVVFTREDDRFIELEERGHIANRAQGDLFISIHTNSNNSSRPHGSEFYFLGLHKSNDAYDVMLRENSVVKLEDAADTDSQNLTEEQLLVYELTNSGYMESSQRLAALMNEQFKNRANRKVRGLKQAGFIVLYYASMPAVLVELGFISNPSEERYMASEYGQTILASALFRAVRTYKEEFERAQRISSNWNHDFKHVRLLNTPLIIGVAGGSGSGKTTVLRHIRDQIGDRNLVLLQHDFYYRDLRHLTFEERSKQNFDHPAALETELMIRHIDALRQGYAVEVPQYDFSKHLRSDVSRSLQPQRIILIDGILIYAEPELRDRMDIKIFVDTDDDVRLLRRLRRDILERGRSLDNVLHQYERYVRPMHLEFVEPSKRFADIIIPRGGKNKVALNMVLAMIRGQMGKQDEDKSPA